MVKKQAGKIFILVLFAVIAGVLFFFAANKGMMAVKKKEAADLVLPT